MSKKRILIIVGIIVLVLLLVVLSKFLDTKKNEQKNINSKYIIEDDIENKGYLIEKNSIEQAKDVNNAEVKDIRVIQNDKQVRVVSTLKNISNEDIDTFSAKIQLLDNEKKIITEIAVFEHVTIKANEEYKFENYYDVENEKVKVKYAKISNLELNYDSNKSDLDTMEEQLEDLESDL